MLFLTILLILLLFLLSQKGYLVGDLSLLQILTTHSSPELLWEAMETLRSQSGSTTGSGTQEKQLQSQNEEEGFPVNQKFEAVSYRLTSKDEGSCPIALNVWSARAGGRNKITMQVEFRSDCELPFRRFERINVSFALAE